MNSSRYYEIELLTYGMVRIGWATTLAPANAVIGTSACSFSFAPDEVCFSLLINHITCMHLIPLCFDFAGSKVSPRQPSLRQAL